jgi:Fic family protein
VPAPLPAKLTYSHELVMALSQADAALGELAGVDGQLPDPRFLDGLFKRQEALCSSRIEGAEVSLSDLLLDQVGAARPEVPRDHLREVRSCIATLRYGVGRLRDVPLSLELVAELHEWLLRGEISSVRSPGEFRTSQNWVGQPGSTLATATYVPPPVPEMLETLGQWDEALQDRGSLPDLIQCALLHEQFEAIHPFVGGNGRLGRLLIILLLIDRQRLARPLLFLSAYLEGHREEYYTLMQRVRTHGEWTPWLLFFLEGVRQTALRARLQAQALVRHYERCHSLLRDDALALADETFRTPCLTIRHARKTLGLSKTAARGAIGRLVGKGLLEEWHPGTKPHLYLARPVLDAALHPLEELRHPARGARKGALLKSESGRRGPVRRADKLMSGAMAMIDAARERQVLLRLTGGLAVRRYCLDLTFMDREYSDIDFVALSAQGREQNKLFADLSYTENLYVSQSTGGNQRQFIRTVALAERHAQEGGQTAQVRPYEAPLVDHVDVFLDVMRMDHDVDVRDRLDLDDYAISPVDALLAKLQIGKINHKDVHDVIALVKDVPLRAVDAETELEISLDVAYFAEVCSQDWGLYHDITTNLDLVLASVGDYGLADDVLLRVRERLTTIRETLSGASKAVAWQVRAAVGERVAWRREVEDTEGTPVIAPVEDRRRDLG